MLTTQSFSEGETETLQTFVLRRLTEDDPSIRDKIYDLVMEFHSEQRQNNTLLLSCRDRRVSFVEQEHRDLIQGISAIDRRIRASNLVARSGFQYLVLAIHAIMLEEGWPAAIEVKNSGTGFRPNFAALPVDVFLLPNWNADSNSICLAYNFESVSLQFSCEDVAGFAVVSACKLCDDFCGPTMRAPLSVDRFVMDRGYPQGFALLDEQAELNLHAEITALVLRIFPEMDDTVVHALPSTTPHSPFTNKRKSRDYTDSSELDPSPLRLPPLPPMSQSPLDQSLPGSVCGSLHDVSSLSSREKEDPLSDFAPLTRSDGPRPKLPSFQEMFECSCSRSDGAVMTHEVYGDCEPLVRAIETHATHDQPVSTTARVSCGDWAGMDYDYALHGSNFYDSLSDESSY